MKKKILLMLAMVLSLASFAGCGGSKETAETEAPADQTEAVETTEAEKTEEAKEEAKKSGDVPVLRVDWSNELHTGNMHLSFLKPEIFKDNPVHLNPISDSQLELVKDGEVIAMIEFFFSKGGSEAVTMMNQGHLDISYNAGSAFMMGYDQGLDVSILNPVQSGGVSIVAYKDAPYNTFEEFVEYAKNAEMPVKVGYHSAISSPRIVQEASFKNAGLVVTEDTADFEADIVMTDLKGISNLIPSMTSKQVEVWAGPVPYPQSAEDQGIGKAIATLDVLPGGQMTEFPCCVMAARDEVIEKYPEIIEAMVQVTTDIHKYAQEEREATAEAMTEFVGLDKEVLMQNDTVYGTKVTDYFVNGMGVYYEAITNMGKFTGRLADKSYEEAVEEVFDFSFSNKVNGIE